MAQVVEYGIVGVNSGTIPTDVAPFGTVKESGLPREGSKYRIEDHLGMKCFCMVGIS